MGNITKRVSNSINSNKSIIIEGIQRPHVSHKQIKYNNKKEN